MRIRVEGQHPLNGHYQPSGSTNAAIALLAASLLTEESVTLTNVPDTTNMKSILAIAGDLGAESTVNGNTITIQTRQLTGRTLSREATGGTIGGLLFLAPILVRRQYVRAELDFPLNRIRTHMDAIRDLGLDMVTTDGDLEIRAATWDYKDILLTQASVTATMIVLMLAACFGKETVVRNAASEPHVQELAHMLEMMGAQVHGIGSNMLRIFGKEGLNGATRSVGLDYIEAASVAAMAALCGGRVQINGLVQEHMRMIGRIYRRLGITLDIDESLIFVPKHDTLTVSNREEDADSSIESMPWPGFPSDLVAMATVVATQARGTSLIHEKLFNNRLLFVDRLKSMGSQIVLCDPHRAIVVGPTPLYAIYMDSPDIRTGLGMLGAALVAQGETVIDNAQVLQRNFDRVLDKLKGLGAQIVIQPERDDE
jgi:UDP-N-acetylglucosamine 1-carboxyvinyltransferase